MKRILFFLIILIASVPAYAQYDISNPPRFIFLPDGLQFVPLRANIEEPRIGVYKFLNNSHMKVDIGNTVDLFGLDVPQENIKFRAGIDFMAYALVTGNQGLRLQIDAVDGFFGGNISFSKSYQGEQLQSRLRILHHSAHLVDGHYSIGAKSWIDNRVPIPYTRDYGELVVAYMLKPEFGTLRYYGGLSYATLIRPSIIKRFEYLAGIEFSADKDVIPVFGKPVSMFSAYHISMTGTPVYAATHQVQVGIKFGKWYGKGISFYVSYYTGRHMFAEYFDERITTIGTGFTVDFF